MKQTFCDVELVLDKSYISEKLKSTGSGVVSTINANIMVHAFLKPSFKKVLQNNTMNICDGSNLMFVINILKGQRYSSYPGPDFFIDVIRTKKYKHVFLGSTKIILDNLRNKLSKIDKKIDDSLFLELPFCDVDEFDFDEIAIKVGKYAPDFIWVSLGAPKQEIFSANLFQKLQRGWVVSVGAAFDFYAEIGKLKRAPIFLRLWRLEWLYRLFYQPRKTIGRLIKELLIMPLLIGYEIFKKK